MLGLCLEGGGAKGAFHIGALKAFLERGFVFDGVTGTSIGAVIGASFVQGDFDGIYQKWMNLSFNDILDIDEKQAANFYNGKRDGENYKYMLKYAWQAIKKGGLSTDRMRTYLKENLNEEKIRNSPLDFGLVTIVTTGKNRGIEIFKEDIPEGELLDYILASAYFPAFERKPLGNGKYFFDGGLYDNLPINMLISKGYDRIIAIKLGSRMPHKKVVNPIAAIDYISPSEPLGRTFSFTHEKIERNATMGYHDALRYIDKLVGSLYYIEPMSDGEFIEWAINTLPQKFFDKQEESKEEQINGFCAEIRECYRPYFSDYEAFIGILELVAKKLSINRFKVRTVDGLITDIKDGLNLTGITGIDIFLNEEKRLFSVLERLNQILIT